MGAMEMERIKAPNGVVLVGGASECVRFAFTERTGGASAAPYTSLNLGTHVGDDPAAVAENRRRVCEALGCEESLQNLLVPNQVHGDRVVTVTPETLGMTTPTARDGRTQTSSAPHPEALVRTQTDIAQGADAIVCTAPGIPVLLCFADCVPVILTCDDAFAVIHSGWKGTYAGIAGKAAQELSRAAAVPANRISAYIGPHICGDEYEVSADLLRTFSLRFDNIKPNASRLLDLSACIRQSLEEVGVLPCEIHDPHLSTMRQNDRFYSYRREQGTCGRHGAVAFIR